ncbi:unnamed protein product [Phytophthora fragariaefolia]|uniref:Unnamed protein product n=1 Tax=Phytophthora fragariaefolia TaxID=1490495 RepID=A0A9W6X5J1_9STRA|nr:unnamed protein product [Phytophthora fragariaefolia]
MGSFGSGRPLSRVPLTPVSDLSDSSAESAKSDLGPKRPSTESANSGFGPSRLPSRVYQIRAGVNRLVFLGARELGVSRHHTYRPKLLGLVERFHRTWKTWLACMSTKSKMTGTLSYLVRSTRITARSTLPLGFQPNELMLGRKLRPPAELLRRNRLKHPHQTLAEYHEALLQDLKTAQELAAIALQKKQTRQTMYYNQRNVRQHAELRTGQPVWMYRPARGPGITKFGHRWRGPGQIIEAAGYNNYLVRMLESDQEVVTHCSFLLPYYYPTHLLDQMARDIAMDLREEAVAAADIDPDDDIDGSQTDGVMETATVDPEIDSSSSQRDTTTAVLAAAVPVTTLVPDEKRTTTAVDISSTTNPPATKRRRGRPRKNTSATAATTDV